MFGLHISGISKTDKKYNPMKKTIYTLFITIIMMVFSSCGPTKEEAIDYNDKIINEQVYIIDKIDKLFDALKNYKDFNGMDKSYTEALRQVETGTAIVGKLDKFGGNTEFRDEALKLFRTYKSVLENELKNMITISKLPDEMYTTGAEDEFNKLSDVSFKKMDVGLKEFNTIQKAFANKYKFEIEKNNPK
jgi:hypothetical protein